MCPGVALQVESVIEALSAEGAEIPLGVAVALHVPVQQSLQSELLGACSALELGWVRVRPHRGQLLLCLNHPVRRHRVLESVAAVNQLDGCVGRNAKLQWGNLLFCNNCRTIHYQVPGFYFQLWYISVYLALH